MGQVGRFPRKTHIESVRVNLGNSFPVEPDELDETLGAAMLPVATPPNAIVISSERITIRTMAQEGFALNLIGVVLVTLICYVMFR